MRAAWIVSLLVLSTHGADAQGIDLTQGGPIQITAKNGIEWRQAEQMVVASGDAKAVRAGVTVTADRLIALYRGRKAAPQGTQPPQVAPAVDPGSEGNEVYRIRAEGNVHVTSATDEGWSDQATYDLDEGVLVMTGRALKLTTPDNTLTARDTLEYWSRKHMAVARGGAQVVTNDGRRMSADTLVAYTVPAASGRPAPVSAPSGSGNAMTAMTGHLDRVEALNNVTIRTVSDIVTGDRGVYVPDTGVARLGGHVRITRGLNQLNGAEAVVNMKTGVATLTAGSTGRVAGLVIPGDRSGGESPESSFTMPGPKDVRPGPRPTGPRATGGAGR